VVTDIRLYESVLAELKETGGSLSLETRARLAFLAYSNTASYDLSIVFFLNLELSEEDYELTKPFDPFALQPQEDEDEEEFDDLKSFGLGKISDLRYG